MVQKRKMQNLKTDKIRSILIWLYRHILLEISGLYTLPSEPFINIQRRLWMQINTDFKHISLALGRLLFLSRILQNLKCCDENYQTDKTSVLLKVFPQEKEYLFVKVTFKWQHFKVFNSTGNLKYETWIMNVISSWTLWAKSIYHTWKLKR